MIGKQIEMATSNVKSLTSNAMPMKSNRYLDPYLVVLPDLLWGRKDPWCTPGRALPTYLVKEVLASTI